MEMIEYLLVRLLYNILHVMPVWAGKALAEMTAVIVGKGIRYRRDVVIDNLRHAFPEMTGSGLKRLLPAIYRHFTYLWFESLQGRRLGKDYFDQCFTAEGVEQITAKTGIGKPVILVSGHLANFEWLGAFMTQYVPDLHAFMKRIHNSRVDRFIKNIRQKSGLYLIYADNQALRKGLKYLKQGKSLAIVGDQDVGERGIYVELLNRPAATAKGTAVLHRMTGIPVYLCTAIRKNYGKFHVIIKQVPDQPASDDKDLDIFTFTQRLSYMLEKMIRRHPEQYFWTHRRWKNQPGPEEYDRFRHNLSAYHKQSA